MGIIPQPGPALETGEWKLEIEARRGRVAAARPWLGLSLLLLPATCALACRGHALQRRQGVAPGHAAGGAHALQVAGRAAGAAVPPGSRQQVRCGAGATTSSPFLSGTPSLQQGLSLRQLARQQSPALLSSASAFIVSASEHATLLPAPLCPLPGRRRSELREVLAPAEVHLPNGMAWDEARGLLFFADSGTETIVEYRTDAQVWHRWGGLGRKVGRRVSPPRRGGKEGGGCGAEGLHCRRGSTCWDHHIRFRRPAPAHSLPPP